MFLFFVYQATQLTISLVPVVVTLQTIHWHKPTTHCQEQIMNPTLYCILHMLLIPNSSLNKLEQQTKRDMELSYSQRLSPKYIIKRKYKLKTYKVSTLNVLLTGNTNYVTTVDLNLLWTYCLLYSINRVLGSCTASIPKTQHGRGYSDWPGCKWKVFSDWLMATDVRTNLYKCTYVYNL